MPWLFFPFRQKCCFQGISARFRQNLCCCVRLFAHLFFGFRSLDKKPVLRILMHPEENCSGEWKLPGLLRFLQLFSFGSKDPLFFSVLWFLRHRYKVPRRFLWSSKPLHPMPRLLLPGFER